MATNSTTRTKTLILSRKNYCTNLLYKSIASRIQSFILNHCKLEVPKPLCSPADAPITLLSKENENQKFSAQSPEKLSNDIAEKIAVRAPTCSTKKMCQSVSSSICEEPSLISIKSSLSNQSSFKILFKSYSSCCSKGSTNEQCHSQKLTNGPSCFQSSEKDPSCFQSSEKDPCCFQSSEKDPSCSRSSVANNPNHSCETTLATSKNKPPHSQKATTALSALSTKVNPIPSQQASPKESTSIISPSPSSQTFTEEQLPKPPKRPYHAFIQDNFVVAKSMHPNKKADEILEILAKRYSQLSTEEKNILKSKYEENMRAYNEQLLALPKEDLQDIQKREAEQREEEKNFGSKMWFKRLKDKLTLEYEKPIFPKRPLKALFHDYCKTQSVPSDMSDTELLTLQRRIWSELTKEKQDEFEKKFKRQAADYKRAKRIWKEKMMANNLHKEMAHILARNRAIAAARVSCIERDQSERRQRKEAFEERRREEAKDRYHLVEEATRAERLLLDAQQDSNQETSEELCTEEIQSRFEDQYIRWKVGSLKEEEARLDSREIELAVHNELVAESLREDYKKKLLIAAEEDWEQRKRYEGLPGETMIREKLLDKLRQTANEEEQKMLQLQQERFEANRTDVEHRIARELHEAMVKIRIGD